MRKKGIILCLICATTLSMSACGFHYKVSLNGKDIVNNETTEAETETKSSTSASSSEETTQEITSSEETTVAEETEDIKYLGEEIEISEAEQLVNKAFSKLKSTEKYILTLSANAPTFQLSKTELLTEVEFTNSYLMTAGDVISVKKVGGRYNGEFTTIEYVEVESNTAEAGWQGLVNNFGHTSKDDLIQKPVNVPKEYTATEVELLGVMTPDITKAYKSEYGEYTIYGKDPTVGMEKIEYILDDNGNLLEIYYDKGIGKDSGLYLVYRDYDLDFKDKFDYVAKKLADSNTYLANTLLGQFGIDTSKTTETTKAESEETPNTDYEQLYKILDHVYEKDKEVVTELEACMDKKLSELQFKSYSLDIPLEDVDPFDVIEIYGSYTAYDDNGNPIKRTVVLTAQNMESVPNSFSSLVMTFYTIR